MKGIRVHEYGGPEVMHLEDLPMPALDAGTVRIKAHVIGVNYVDIYQRSGQHHLALPFTPGVETAGLVDAVGGGVAAFKPGDRVIARLNSGAYAEYAVAPADKVVQVPDDLDLRLAITGLTQGMTAHYLSHDTFPLQPGHTALVHAGAGGTGQLLVQMAKMRGARVIGTVSTEQKGQLARDLGADEVIIYTQRDFEAEVKCLTGGRGVDVVYDSVGKDTFEKGLNCLRPRGYMVLYGQSSGAVLPFDLQILAGKGSLFVTRPSLTHHVASREEMQRRADDIFTWMTAGQLKVSIDRSFPLADAAAAHTALASRATQGKVLLIP